MSDGVNRDAATKRRVMPVEAAAAQPHKWKREVAQAPASPGTPAQGHTSRTGCGGYL